jgi:endoglycosylceramidase
MAWARRVAIAWAIVALGCAPPAAWPPEVDSDGAPAPGAARRASGARELVADGRVLRDRLGRSVILRGVNLDGASKLPPFAALRDLAQLDALPAVGANVLRLPVMWEAIEPAPGRYDEAQLATLESVADAAWARGLYVIVDVHQDAFSRFAGEGCGSGFPRWVVAAAVGEAMVRQPRNDGDCYYWGTMTLFDSDIAAAWRGFYADRGGVRRRYLLLLALLARRFARHAGVIAYDLLNEPGGDEVRDVGPLYRDAAAAVRAADPEALVLVEPSAAAVSLGGGQKRLPRLDGSNVIYSPHYYDFGLNLWGSWGGSRWLMNRAVSKMAARAAAWDVPLLVGELGAPARGWRAGEHMAALWDELDAVQASGLQWVYAPLWSEEQKDGWNREDFSIVDGRGALRANFRVRPYPQRVAGELDGFGVARDGTLTVQWRNGSDAPTLLFAPRRTGGRIESAAGVRCAFAADRLHVECRAGVRGPAWVRVYER